MLVSAPQVVKVIVVADVVCTWCFIGKRRLDKAIATLKGRGFNVDFDIKWMPFELTSGRNLTKEGISKKARLLEKYSPETVDRMHALMVDQGKKDNIQFNPDGVVSSTLDAHRLLHFADMNDLQNQTIEALFSAYHEHAQNIGDNETLADIYASVGGNRDEALEFLNSDSARDIVRAQQEQARMDGITGVPFFNIGGVLVRGAIEADEFLKVLEGLFST
eukprot:jgi/Hompol1/1192/HPOL_002660-RA